ncbi:hypothetical protein GGQ73_001764 [Rhizobium skierniewicense]|uniref:Uncharacterized protein n=1 Tax=Rhizobium skierniewicense TaxID=984260 RepID=A0A7W6G1W7_9HYPH|nr:hypothetical protein [Rhizobium skierniewicense]MBB3945829.1 hypothetical protein [Rhizobium skierniewicense]
MTSLHYKIIVRNLSPRLQHFHVFQKRAEFQSSSTIASISSSSIGCRAVDEFSSTGSEISFELGRQIYAGAVSTAPGTTVPQPATFAVENEARWPINTVRAIRRVELTSTKSTNALNSSVLSLNPLGLSHPIYSPEIAAGAFGVNLPPYDPSPFPELCWGVAALSAEGCIMLSSYITPPPNSMVTCSPQQVFFVKTGFVPDGDAIFYDESHAARCDFTTGLRKILVNYNADGTFSTSDIP